MEHYEKYIGMTLGRKYVIDEIIGKGGMAYVFKATVKATGETVSVKILNEESARDEKAVKRFVNESKAVSMLNHKNIVGVYDVGVENGINYIVMEYVDGITLKEYIDFKKCIEWKEAVYYISQVLKALGHAHSTGIIHRDVKPQNIMITRDGTIKVMDFGIAKMMNSKPITVTDKAIGTVDYISPEQASAKPVGFFSDIYSVGIMLYEMTTGTLPFIAESPMAVAMMQIQNEPEAPRELNPSLPRGLEQIILKALNKEPDDRFSSCAAMDKALALLCQNPSVIFTQQKKSATQKKTAEKSSSFLPVIAGITISFFIVALAVAASIGIKFYKTQFSDMGEDIRIPDLIGKQYSEELILQLEEDKFDITVEYSEYDPDKAIGEIVGQTPDGGTTRKLSNPNSSCAVTIMINTEPGKVVIDNYTNFEARIARMQLTKLGLVPETRTKRDNTVIEGYVISTEPEAGATVEAGSTVVLYVSSGALLTVSSMPDVIGLDIEQAKKKIVSKNIRIGEIVYEDSYEPAGTVIFSSVAAGESIPEKITGISLTVSRGNLAPPVSDEQENGDETPDENEQKDENNRDGETEVNEDSDIKEDEEVSDKPSEI